MAKHIKETELHTVLMKRDDLTLEEANNTVVEMRNRMNNGENPEDLLYEMGLEMDYFPDLMYE